MADEFRMICDFDAKVRPWMSEYSLTPDIRVTRGTSRSGKASLAVDVRRTGKALRATWGAEVFDVELSSRSRIKVCIHGSPLLKTDVGQPHGGLVLVESGGGADGRDSHWMIDIPGEIYGANEWRDFISPPLTEARNPEWAIDTNGKIDFDRISRMLFILQRDDPYGEMPEFTIHLDDLSATLWKERRPTVSLAVNSSVPEYVREVERGFIGRKRDPGQTISFQDVSGWRTLCYGASDARFVRSEEEPLFGEPVGKLLYKGGDGPGYVRLEPPRPIRLREFNALLFWLSGNSWAWVPRPDAPFVTVSIELTDSSGEKHLIDLDRVDWKFWSMIHKCVPADARADERRIAYGGDGNGILNFPASLTGIEVRGGTNKEFRALYFDSIIFRTEKPDLPEFSACLDDLPFPTTPDTILPSLDEPVRTSVMRRGLTYIFRAESPSGMLEYRYVPRTGTLSDLTAVLGASRFKPCDGGGPIIEGESSKAVLLDTGLGDDDVVRTRWRVGETEYGLDLAIKGKSLICDWRSDGGRISEFSLGRASGLSDYKLFNVPYLSMGYGTPPAVLWNKGAYCLTLLDWYDTNASQFYGRTDRLSDTEAVLNGGSKYLPLTDGSRNSLRERQFITVSHRFEDVLPNIPNPPSPFADVTGRNLYLHVNRSGADRYKIWLEKWKRYKEYGIDHVRISQHEECFSEPDEYGQGPQEFTMTLDAAPAIGDQQLIDYCRQVRELGWLIGLYTNYVDYSMLGKSWDERNVTKRSNGEWQRSWPPTFRIKPLKAVEMEAYYAPRIAEKFGVNTVYCDVHTAIPPWDNVDHEAGTPGAGKFLTTFKSYGALMMNERDAYGGPVFSEGIHHWFYAGLNDGNYGQMGIPEPETQPFLLDFNLRKIHPLQSNVSMYPSWVWGDGKYHTMAAQIAYGHLGFLPEADIATTAWGYYMMQQLQLRYNQVPVETILYHAGDGRMLPVSDALPIGAHMENQVHVRYANGLDVYVNCNREKRWKVTAGGREFDLSTHSWAAVGPDFLEYSTEIDGRRVNYVDSSVYTYADAGGVLRDFGPVETSGSVVIRKDDARGLKVIPIAGTDRVRIPGSTAAEVIAYSGDDREIGPADIGASGSGLEIILHPDARYYIVDRPS